MKIQAVLQLQSGPSSTWWRAPTPLVSTRPTTFCTSCVVRSGELETQRHINKIEAIVPAICLCTWSHLIRGSLLATLHLLRCCFGLPCLRMPKKQLCIRCLDYTWAQILGCWPWFERVPSACILWMNSQLFLHCACE